MTGRLRVALVGPGDVAGRDYLPEWGRIDGRVEVVAVCGRGEARAREVGERLGAPWYTDVARMLEDEAVDAVVNLTPIHVHEEVTAAALAAGAHVYSEKPLATSAAAARRLAETARRAGLILVPAPVVMCFPQVELARRLLADGAIGEVRTARSVMLGGVPPWEGYTSDPGPFFSAAAGPLVDLGVYGLHALTGLVGPLRQVGAMSSRSRDHFDVADGPFAGLRIPVEVDDAWTLTLDLGEGRLGSLEANFTAHGSGAAELELMGTTGTMTLSLLDVSRPVEVLTPDGEWARHPSEAARAAGPDHILGIEHLVDVVEGAVEQVLTAAHAIHVLDVIEAAAEAAAAGVVRPVTSTVERNEKHP